MRKRNPRPIRGNAPGMALAGAGLLLAVAVHAAIPGVPTLTAAVLLGVLVAHLPGLRLLVHGPGRRGLGFAGKHLMRAGVVLLGLNLSLGDVLGLGWSTVAVVLGVVLVTFLGTWWLGHRLGVSGDRPLLVAAGYAICGASAVAAVGGALDREDDPEHASDVVTSVALVTLCGTLAIAVLPLLHQPLGLDAVQFGRWTGAGVHDVGQVVATARTAGPTALEEAVLVKLIRVALLAPLVAGVVVVRRLRPANGAERGRSAGVRRTSPVPLFVLGFLAMTALRSVAPIPAQMLSVAHTAQELLLAAALFGLGSAVHLPTLARSGTRTAMLGLLAWVVVASAAYGGVLLTTGG